MLFNDSDKAADFFASRTIRPIQDLSPLLSMEDKASIEKAIVSETIIPAEFYREKEHLTAFLNSVPEQQYRHFVRASSLNFDFKYESGLHIFFSNLPHWIFILVSLFMVYLAFKHKLSLIPLLGLMSCLYMMSELGLKNWVGFGIWLLVGLIIYFFYGFRKSHLNN
jgi:hypothetical protein